MEDFTIRIFIELSTGLFSCQWVLDCICSKYRIYAVFSYTIGTRTRQFPLNPLLMVSILPIKIHVVCKWQIKKEWQRERDRERYICHLNNAR